jgi:S-adenosyl methyltransferase
VCWHVPAAHPLLLSGLWKERSHFLKIVACTSEFCAATMRAVSWAANQGIAQSIDLGCGLPTTPNTRESARAVIPDAKVAYVDNEPVVPGHLTALIAKGDPVASYAGALAKGSCIVISVVHADSDAADEGFGGYSRSVAPVYNHSAEDFARFFGPLELVPPGAVDARQWQPGWESTLPLGKREGHVLAAVARV